MTAKAAMPTGHGAGGGGFASAKQVMLQTAASGGDRDDNVGIESGGSGGGGSGVGSQQRTYSHHSAGFEGAVKEEWQGLTLVHFSAQRKRFLRDRGCIQG
jgi:hypothetical protein